MKRSLLLIALSWLFLLAGCAAGLPDLHAQRFLEKLSRYPQTSDPLKIPRLTGASFNALSRSAASHDVFIIVHPGYSLFFRPESRSRYSEAKYALLATQFENEARFLAGASRSGTIVILIIPAQYESESIAPLSYTAYLNSAAEGGRDIFYLFSSSPSTGSVPMNDLVDLYRFLQKIKAGKVLIGGGFIGRCQREFYKELTAYFDQAPTFIVPELSTISPDDISEAEAGSILKSIQQQDYSPVRKFIDKKLDNAANLLSIPPIRQM